MAKRKVAIVARDKGNWINVGDAVKWYMETYHATYRTARRTIYESHKHDHSKGFPSRVLVESPGKRGTIQMQREQMILWYEEQLQQRRARTAGACLKPALVQPTTATSTGSSPSARLGVDNAKVVLDPNELAYIESLADPNATPVQKGRATYNLCTLRLSRMAREGEVSGTMLSEISRSLQELRRSEEGYMSIEAQRGELVPLELCQEVVGELVKRLNDICAKLSALLGTEIEVWLTATMTSTERRKVIRAWLQRQMHDLRSLEGRAVQEITEEIIARVNRRHEELKGKATQ